MTEAPKETGALGFKLNVLTDCEPRSSRERIRNIAIASRIRSIFEKRTTDSLTPNAIIFLTGRLPDAGISIEDYTQGKKCPEIVPEKFDSPFYRIATNSYGRKFVNSKDGLVYRIDVMYYFNSRGQAIKHALVDKEPKESIHQEPKLKEGLRKLEDVLPGKKSIFRNFDHEDYIFIRRWLRHIESGKCMERYPVETQAVETLVTPLASK
jgi:hypothetical protein